MNFDDPDFVIRACKCSVQEDVVLCFYKGKDKVVRIPDGVTMIEDYAFGSKSEPNTTVQKIIMPDTVNWVETDAFSYCQALTDIKFSKLLDFLCLSFEGCDAMTEFSIPESVKSIGCVRRERSLAKIHVHGDITNINERAFLFADSKPCDYTRLELIGDKWCHQETIKVLLENPAYAIIDGFMVNTVHKTTLFRTDFGFIYDNEMRIPDGMEVIGNETFDESEFDSDEDDGFRIRKITIPESVKKIESYAFSYCDFLAEVIYEGNPAKLEIEDSAFSDCKLIHNNGSNIIFTEETSDSITDSKLSNMKLERLVFIHHCFQQGRYMNKNQLQAELMRHFGLAKLGISTITRDLEFLRDRFDAPIEYDFFHKGYHYTEEFELTL